MNREKRTREQMLAFCGEIHHDDGIDPRVYFRPSKRRDKENRKALQLCRQVAQTLTLVLAGDGQDEVLDLLQVDSVVPAPDTSRLLVSLRTDWWGLDPAVVEHRLDAQHGRLRCEVAAAITRRRAPVLVYRVLGPDGKELS